jgi:acetoin:2,6-dichlorophenolindophenol oxidoreductase subunit beta
MPLSKANIVRQGRDVTVMGTHIYIGRVLEAADKLADEGIEVEIIAPRTLVPLDKETIVNSVVKTEGLLWCMKLTEHVEWEQKLLP